MGMLDNDSIIVDAILTKNGRKLLAEGKGLNISSFALSDDYVNYNLWNTGHPSGSDNYGAAITSMPLPEVSSNAQVAARYFLTTRKRTQKFQPFIKIQEDPDANGMRLDHAGKPGITLTPYLENGSSATFTFEFSDTTGLLISGGGHNDLGGSTVAFPRVTGYYVPQPGLFTGSQLRIQATTEEKAFQFQITIFEKNSGAAPLEVIVNVDANLFQKPSDKITGKSGGV